jgi:hypothetical protein
MFECFPLGFLWHFTLTEYGVCILDTTEKLWWVIQCAFWNYIRRKMKNVVSTKVKIRANLGVWKKKLVTKSILRFTNICKTEKRKFFFFLQTNDNMKRQWYSYSTLYSCVNTYCHRIWHKRIPNSHCRGMGHCYICYIGCRSSHWWSNSQQLQKAIKDLLDKSVPYKAWKPYRQQEVVSHANPMFLYR